MGAKRNPLEDLAGDNPVKRGALKHIGQTARAGWDAAAYELIHSPLGQEYKKQGVHEDRIPQYAEAMRTWITSGRNPEKQPNIEDYKEPLVPDWQADLGPKPPSRQ